MKNYRKLITVAVGLVVMLAAHHGFDLSGQEAMLVDTIVSLLTAFGVYQVPNTGSGSAPGGTQRGFARLGILPLLIVLSLAAAGCGALGAITQPLPRAESSDPAPVKAARAAIDEANAALIGLNVVIADNAAAKVWTPDQAQAYLDESKAAGAKLDQARELLKAGLPLDARTQAEAVRTLVIALHRQVAAAARKEN